MVKVEVGVKVDVIVAVLVGVKVMVGVAVKVGVRVMVAVGVSVGVSVAVAVGVSVEVSVGVGAWAKRGAVIKSSPRRINTFSGNFIKEIINSWLNNWNTLR